MSCTLVRLNGTMWEEAGEPGILIMHGFFSTGGTSPTPLAALDRVSLP